MTQEIRRRLDHGHSVAVEVSGAPAAPVVVVTGEIDVATSPQLRTELNRSSSAAHGDITLEFGGVSFVDSSGLGVLVGTYKRLREDGLGLDPHRRRAGVGAQGVRDHRSRKTPCSSTETDLRDDSLRENSMPGTPGRESRDASHRSLGRTSGQAALALLLGAPLGHLTLVLGDLGIEVVRCRRARFLVGGLAVGTGLPLASSRSACTRLAARSGRLVAHRAPPGPVGGLAVGRSELSCRRYPAHADVNRGGAGFASASTGARPRRSPSAIRNERKETSHGKPRRSQGPSEAGRRRSHRRRRPAREGKVDEKAGQAKDKVGDLKDKAESAIDKVKDKVTGK